MKKHLITVLFSMALMIMALGTAAFAEDGGFTNPVDGDYVLLGSEVQISYTVKVTAANNQTYCRLSVESPSGAVTEFDYDDSACEGHVTSASFTPTEEGNYKISALVGNYIIMNMGMSSTKYRGTFDGYPETITVKAVKELPAATADATADVTADATADANRVKTLTVNAKTVNAKVLNKALKKAGGSEKNVTKIVLGKKVSKISASAFKKFKKAKTLEVKTTKLTKKSVKNSLKGSAVKTVKVKVGKAKANKQYVGKYKKIFTKKNAGKKVTVK